MDMASKADKIASARKLLKSYQQKKTKVDKPASPAPASDFTILSEPPGPTFIEDAVSIEKPPDHAPLIPEQPPGSVNEAAKSSPQLPIFTFPADGSTSFSEYLGNPPTPVPTPPTAPGATAEMSFSGMEPPPPPAAEPPQPAAEAHPSPPPPTGTEVPQEPAAGPVQDDSPPGASMASSFTFAGSQPSGPGSQGSAASSRHSDWEYVVGGQQEAAAGPDTAGAQQERAEVAAAPAPAHLTSETLRQLSDRLSQMTSEGEEAEGEPSAAGPPATDQRLAQRNAELAAALEAERRARAEAERTLEDLRARLSELEQEQESGRRAADLRLEQERARLAEQARAQAQTIGILVAEKTELKTAAEQLQARLEEKQAECDASSSQLAAAQVQIQQLREESSRAGQIEVSVQHLQSLYAQADNERNRNRELCSELQEELDEARQRLRTQLDANQALTRQLADTNSRLELAEIRLTQLGGGGGEGESGSGSGAEERAAAAEREAAQLRAERDAASVQFREYTAALSARLQQAEAARDTLTAELAARDDQATAAAAAAPPPEQPRQEAAVQQTPPPAVTDTERRELEELRQAAAGAAEETDTLRRELRALSEENTRLTLSSQQQAAELQEMKFTVERVNSSAVDNGQLAREMESDRVAASRAMAQNKQLKQQLQELQDGFITLSNKKLELTESLAAERQASAERARQVVELQEQLDKMTARAAEADRQNMTAHQVIDQLRHWEAVGRHAQALQADLTAAEEKLSRLGSAAPSAAGSETASGAPERPPSAAGSEPLSSRTQSPVPRPPIEEVIREREELRARLQQFIGGGAVDPAEHEKLRSALAQLEKRFCEVMNQVAVLREERQGLEHLCEQLQGETDTIGDYISMYQVQRSALKQQALEREQELNTLNEDRQQLRQQLAQLQQLVSQLMGGQQPAAGAPPAAVPAPAAPDSGTSSPAEPTAPSAPSEPSGPPAPAEPARQQTAQRILSLIEQIGASEYVDGHAAPLHVCQHCRGKRVLNV
ncbi:golgin subfamily A member 2-like isoform X1 [Amphibalanus amphitrite]|uniref:golgin subfamily A member 2-like isoform X1 n=1 Tax=Amphibalanus amphitrite TaxID=1232801 RepID=UPI001C91D585|nr:golgin subfamily A member 2-like isoform X1 [Amphibalanus amphitrite]XP_043247757.1 golgin subfamily A member 2-like isoform X1 [Amphibalanus amphitrite]